MGSYRRTRRRGAQSRRRTDRRRTGRKTGRRTYRRKTGRRTYRHRRVSQRKGRRRTSRRRTSRRYQMRGGAESLLAGQFYMDVVRDDRDMTRLEYSPPRGPSLMIMQMIGAKIDRDDKGDYWKYYCRVIRNYGHPSPNLVNKYFGFRYSQLKGATRQPRRIPCDLLAETRTRVIERMEEIITQGRTKHKLSIKYDIPLSHATNYFTDDCPDLQVMYGRIASMGGQREAFSVPKSMEHQAQGQAQEQAQADAQEKARQQEAEVIDALETEQQQQNKVTGLNPKATAFFPYSDTLQANAIKKAVEVQTMEEDITRRINDITHNTRQVNIAKRKSEVRGRSIKDKIQELQNMEDNLAQIETDAIALQSVLSNYRKEKGEVEEYKNKIQSMIVSLGIDTGETVETSGSKNLTPEVKAELLRELQGKKSELESITEQHETILGKINVQESVQGALIDNMSRFITQIKQKKEEIENMKISKQLQDTRIEDFETQIETLKQQIGDIAGGLERLVDTSNAPVPTGSE